jgi:hypothetical protein
MRSIYSWINPKTCSKPAMRFAFVTMTRLARKKLMKGEPVARLPTGTFSRVT